MRWNTARILIDENQSAEAVASALRRFADNLEAGILEGFNVVALRAADGSLVGAATLSFGVKSDG